MKLISLFLVCMALLFTECNPQKLNAMQQTIKEAHTVRLFQIENTPTLPEEQQNSSAYICNYKIMDEISLSDEKTQQLKKVVLDSSNYIVGMQKKCMMMPTYAMYFQSQKDTLEMVVSIKACPKAIIKHSSDNEKSHVDLTEDSSIRKVLDSLVK